MDVVLFANVVADLINDELEEEEGGAEEEDSEDSDSERKRKRKRKSEFIAPICRISIIDPFPL